MMGLRNFQGRQGGREEEEEQSFRVHLFDFTTLPDAILPSSGKIFRYGNRMNTKVYRRATSNRESYARINTNLR